MQQDAKTGLSVNILNNARPLAVDAVSTHLFQEHCNRALENGNKLSVFAFVEALVAVEGFLCIPNTAFIWLEWAIEKLNPDQQTATSMDVAGKFLNTIVSSTPFGAMNYLGRTMALGLERLEVKAQCKGLIFAGMNLRGMNLANVCQQLTLNPDK